MKTQKKLWFIAILIAVPFIVNAQQWGNNGTSIYNTNTGNVGIGKTDPGVALDVVGAGTYGVSRLTSPVDVTPQCHLELFAPQGTGGVRPISIRFHQSSTTWGRLEYNGNFHFKTGDPASQAYVNVYTGNLYINKPNAQLSLVSPDANRAQMTIYTQGDGANDLFLGVNGLSQRYSISGRNSAEGYDLKIYRNNGGWQSMMTFDWATGYVGLKTENPEARLHVSSGNILLDNDYSIQWKNASGVIQNILKVSTDNQIYLYSAGALQLRPGVHIIPLNINTYDLGSSSITWRDLWLGRNAIINGSVGIGATAPAGQLHLARDGAWTGMSGGDLLVTGKTNVNKRLIIDYDDIANVARLQAGEYSVGYHPIALQPENGNVGIGTTVPGAKLEVEIGAGTAEFDKGIVIHSGNGTYTSGHGNMLQFENEDVVVAGIRGDREGGWAGDLQFFTHLNSAGNTYGATFTEKMRITAAGNVGIGTINPTQKLTVNGKILAEEVEVIADVPDYVFKEDYKLMSLAELDKFIKANKHLPEVPSEKEVQDNGSKIGLGEMNHILLKKIEELTLYAIDQEKNSDKQDEVIKELLIQNETILKRVTELEKQ